MQPPENPVSYENRCKGTNILGFFRVLRREGSDSREAECLAKLPEDLGAALRYGAIVRGGWYPIRWYRALFASAQAIGMGPNFPRTVGRIATLEDLSGGIYSIFVRVVSPAFLISGAARLFSRYYESGTMVIADSRHGFVRVSCKGCKGFDRNIWQNVLGGSEGALQAAGAHDIRLRPLDGGGDDDEGASFEAYYRE